MKRRNNEVLVPQPVSFAFLAISMALTNMSTHAAPLQMPVSASSGSTKSLSVQLDVESATHTLFGPSPTAQNGPSENPAVTTRSVKLTHSKPATTSPSAHHLLAGPTLRVRPGDRLNILFRNNLTYQESAGDGSHSTTNPHGFDVINLHTHGLHVSPQSPSDNVLLNIFPKQTPQGPLNECYAEFGKANCVMEKFAYAYKIPANHPSGTYWYHAHKHGAVAMHLADGVAGALIIEDPLHGLESLPAVRKAREQIILLQEIAYGGKYPDGTGSGTPNDPYRVDCMSVYGNQNGCAFGGPKPPAPGITNSELSVNGQFQPTITMLTNEAQLWRVINGSIGNVVPMCLVPVGNNDNTVAATPVAYVLATDGVPVQNPNASKQDLPVRLANPVAKPVSGNDILNNELLLLAAGQRLDLMVKAPAVPGTYALYDSVDQSGNAIPANELCQAATYAQLTPILTVTVEASASEIAVNTEVPTQQALNKLIAPATITAAESPELPTQGAVFGFTNDEFAPIDNGASVINARVFNPIRSQRNLALQQVDLWSAQSAVGTHMFHIHINSFQLVSRGLIKYPFPIWRDTLLVETSSDNQGNSAIGEIVQFLQKPLDYTGSLVMHCHNVFHEDNGMMELVNILSPSGSQQSLQKKHAH